VELNIKLFSMIPKPIVVNTAIHPIEALKAVKNAREI
jgi:hypothetical protein